jgi:hypothetical protein
VLFAYDTEASLRSAVALVNSAIEPDTLTEISQVDAWYAEQGFTGRRDGDAAELEALRALRPVLRELLTAERDDAAELVNTLLADAQAIPPAKVATPFESPRVKQWIEVLIREATEQRYRLPGAASPGRGSGSGG